MDNYEYLTGWEILLSNQRQIRKQTKFFFEKQAKTIEEQREKKVKTIEDQGENIF